MKKIYRFLVPIWYQKLTMIRNCWKIRNSLIILDILNQVQFSSHSYTLYSILDVYVIIKLRYLTFWITLYIRMRTSTGTVEFSCVHELYSTNCSNCIIQGHKYCLKSKILCWCIIFLESSVYIGFVTKKIKKFRL